MFSSVRNTLIGVSLTLAATSAAALPITFDFSGTNHLLGRTHVYSQGGLDLTATASSSYGWKNRLTQTTSGLGVTHIFDSNWQLDGYGPDESVTFSFSRSVRLLGFTLAGIGHNDDYTLSVDSVTQIAGDIPNGGTVNTSFDGTDFGFGVTGGNDDYYINSLTVDAVDVPEPGTIALFAVGLIGLGVARKRAKQ